MAQLDAVAAVGLPDGTQYTITTCACGFQAAHRVQANALALHASHAGSCDWSGPPSPGGAKTVGTSASNAPLTPAQIASAIGVSVGQLSPAGT